jgi:hypothetical protein
VRGVVDENIDAAERLDGALDHGTAMRAIAQIARHEDGFSPFLLDQLLDLLRVVVFAEIGDQHVRPLARIGDRDGSPNAAVAAGDDRFQALEFAVALVAGLSVIRTRIHSAGPAGHRLLLVRVWRLRIL